MQGVPVRRLEVWLFVPFCGGSRDDCGRVLAMMAKKHRAWLYPGVASG